MLSAYQTAVVLDTLSSCVSFCVTLLFFFCMLTDSHTKKMYLLQNWFCAKLPKHKTTLVFLILYRNAIFMSTLFLRALWIFCFVEAQKQICFKNGLRWRHGCCFFPILIFLKQKLIFLKWAYANELEGIKCLFLQELIQDILWITWNDISVWTVYKVIFLVNVSWRTKLG